MDPYTAVPVAVDGEPRGHFVVASFTTTERDEIAAALRWMALACLLVLILTAAGGYLAMGRALRPLRTVTETAHLIEEDDLAKRIDVTGSDEVADLAATFNGMLDRLEQAFATLRAFLSDAGHELRTPITIVRGHLEVMGDDPADRAETLALATASSPTSCGWRPSTPPHCCGRYTPRRPRSPTGTGNSGRCHRPTSPATANGSPKP